jgi:uncharacterized protein with GYD domain
LRLSRYVLFINWTEQGIGKINESPDRYSPFKALAEKSGGVVLIIEAPNDEAVMSLMLKVGSAGNVKTKTLNALTAEEGFKVIKNLP